MNSVPGLSMTAHFPHSKRQCLDYRDGKLKQFTCRRETSIRSESTQTEIEEIGIVVL